jgi:hypothetical protein
MVYGEGEDFLERDATGGDASAREAVVLRVCVADVPRARDDWRAAGAVGAPGAGAPLGVGDDAEDSCSEPPEFDDGRAGTCSLAVVSGIATG